MSQQKLLSRATTALEAAEVEFMLTGSLVSSLQGEPRATHDVDLVIEIGASSRSVQQLSNIISSTFPVDGYYWSRDAIRSALMTRQMFNVMEIETGDKIDFWMLTNDDFDRERFSRRIESTIAGLKLPVSSPEDTILQKLKWADESGGSEKHFGDALSVYEVQRSSLDEKYLDLWADRLGVVKLLRRLREEAEEV